ncbi:hypothetical protein HZC53_01350 [Candidatus Uhrbacteria bacterium]|nr:hypothetical protein [Candidatus Uhrbacteria bacterium]
MKNPERKQVSRTETTDDSGEFEVRPELRGEFDKLRWLEEEQLAAPKEKRQTTAKPSSDKLNLRHKRMAEETVRQAEQARGKLAVLKKPTDEAWRRKKLSELDREIEETHEMMTERPPAASDTEWQAFQNDCRKLLDELEGQKLRFARLERDPEEPKIAELEKEITRLENFKTGHSRKKLEAETGEGEQQGTETLRDLQELKKDLMKIEQVGPELRLAVLQEIKEQVPLFWFLDPKRRLADKIFSPDFAPQGSEKEKTEYDKLMKANYPKESAKFRRTCQDLMRMRKNSGTQDRYNLVELESALDEYYAVDTSQRKIEIDGKIAAKLEEIRMRNKTAEQPTTPYFPTSNK